LPTEALSFQLAIQPKELLQVQAILTKTIPRLTVWAYGSRVHRRHLKPFSDLDLVIFSEQDNPVDSMEIQEIFDESDLPFTVDVSIWEQLPEWLHLEVLKEHVVLQAF
jgi:uncharacterized protein